MRGVSPTLPPHCKIVSGLVQEGRQNYMKNFRKKLAPMLLGAFLLALLPTTMLAHAPTPFVPNGFNYHFHSGANFRYDLGRPTTFTGNVPLNVFTANIRRDSNVALWPPSYGVFSGFIPTMPTNPLFPQPPMWRL